MPQVGGAISIEMQLPKLLWLKNSNPTTYSRLGHAIDLVDFLTFKATGNLARLRKAPESGASVNRDSRSQCTVVSKWCCFADEDSTAWDDDYLTTIGLDELIRNEHSIIGNTVGLVPLRAAKVI